MIDYLVQPQGHVNMFITGFSSKRRPHGTHTPPTGSKDHDRETLGGPTSYLPTHY